MTDVLTEKPGGRLYTGCLVLILGLIFLGGIAAMFVDDKKEDQPAKPAKAEPAKQEATTDDTPPPTGDDSAAKVDAESEKPKTLADAIEANKSDMGTSTDAFSPGALALAGYSVDGMSWSALTAVPETKPKLVKKDVEEEAGKRICERGLVVEIQADPTPLGKIYEGGLLGNDGELYRFIAVKSTGNIAEHSAARFCGIVAGNMAYSNSMGGTAHAIQLVGMFDLPENR